MVGTHVIGDYDKLLWYLQKLKKNDKKKAFY
jgi:hypothetical protein